MKTVKKVLFFTSTRADFGLLYPLIKRFTDDPNYQTEILATGTHLMAKFGSTLSEIESLGLTVKYKAEIDFTNNSHEDVLDISARCLTEFKKVLSAYQPDLCFVLGDRFEAGCFAYASYIFKTPLAHIHGGEVTEGAIDDSIRHTITKYAQLHFTSAEQHRRRVVQLGEQVDSVFDVGAMGVENVRNERLFTREELQSKLSFKLPEKFFAMTFHSETLTDMDESKFAEELYLGLENYLQHDASMSFVITQGNIDPGYQVIQKVIDRLLANYPARVHFFKSLGFKGYLSLIKESVAVVGNSSSGLIEVPALDKVTVNIGDRQKGRLCGNSVLNARCYSAEIFQTLKNAVELNQKIARQEFSVVSPYGNGNASQNIKSIIDQISATKKLSVRKRFYDLKDC